MSHGLARRRPRAAPAWVAWIDARDRACLTAVAGAPRTARRTRAWRAVTHAGGARVTTAWCAAPLALGAAGAAPGALRLGLAVTAVVLLSQAAVHLVKRAVCRARPACRPGVVARAAEPDAFSFPSGHGAAAMAVALGYLIGWPPAALGVAGAALLVALTALALVVGASRVVLGVHYPGDVLAGQLLSAAAALAVRAAGVA